jgi:uncharacterized integral membrane protein
MRIIYTALIILFVAAVVVFCLQNLHNVTVSYLGWGMNLPLPVLVLLVYLLGMATGWGVWAFLRRSIQGATRKPQ